MGTETGGKCNTVSIWCEMIAAKKEKEKQAVCRK